MKLLLLVVLSTFLSAQMISRTQLIMGTFVTIKLEKQNARFIQTSFDIIKKVDNSLSSFKEKSIISILNKNKKVKLDSFSFEALTLSKKYYEDTNKYFDISIGSITKDLYRFGEDERVPNVKELYDAKVDFNALVFDKRHASLKEGIKVDLGGMGKGFGIDKVSEYLVYKKITKAIVSASGDIRCIGVCTLSIQNPFNDTMMLSFKTKTKNTGISTSGNYNRFVKDIVNNHLINPKTKLSGQVFASITLVSDIESSALDAYATAISVMPKEKAYQFLDEIEVGYVVVEVGGKISVKPCEFFDLLSSSK